ncbi:MAG: trypsin-like peptidase domain-containing protein, partial [Bacteroidota bacterium]
MDVKTLEAAIVCINDTQGNIAGTGFLLDKIERLIVTCTHVLHEGVGVGDSVSIFFYATQEQVNVTVTQYVFSKNEEDIAILQIEEPLPNKVEAIRLGYSRYTTGHEFLTHGFPPGVPREVGLRGKGEIQLLLKDTKLKGNYDLQLKSSEITSGFSGAPIFDTTTSLVVGMIISIMPTDMYGRLSEVAYAISSETLLHYFPFLQQCRTECPYKGLRAFNEQDSNFFYGRQSAIENLIKKLENNPNFLAILGPSGSGKSSLVRAGLIPALRAGRLRGIKSWEIVIIRPEEDLVTANAEFLYGSNDLISAVQFWCQSVSSEKHLLIFIDQFEELFTTCPKS